MSSDPASPRGGVRRVVRVLGFTGVGLVVLTGGAYAADVALAGDSVARGVEVAGVEIGGLERSAAAARLRTGLAERAEAPLLLDADGERLELDPAEAGLSVDVEATLDEAGTGSLSPLARVRGLLGTRPVDPVAAVDEDALERAVEELAEQVDRPAREGAIGFEGTRIKSVDPQTGRELDTTATAEAVRAAYLRTEGPVVVPVEVTEVRSTPEGVATARREVAEPAVAAPVRLVIDGRTVEVPPAAIGAALSIPADPETGEMTPRLDPARLDAALEDVLEPVESPPVDATFRLVGGVPQVVPAQDGRTADPRRLAQALLPVLRQPPPRVLSFVLTPEAPALTTQEAAALGVKEQISTFTTYHPCCRPRVQNIHRIADLVDGTLVLPGETFSLNGHVGPRTRAKGFVEAPQILEGEFVDRVGGGVSQFATTIFNAVFFAGLEDVQHTPHSYYISRYPVGRESTVSFPEPDFRFRNDSPHGVLIDTAYTDTSITVSFYGTERYEIESITGPRTRIRPFTTQEVDRVDCTSSAGEEGFDIVVTRVFKQNGREVKREPFRTRYKPEPRFVCTNPAAAGR